MDTCKLKDYKTRGKHAELWAHFRLRSEPSGKKIAQCNYCHIDLAKHSNQNQYHLARCPGPVPEADRAKYRAVLDNGLRNIIKGTRVVNWNEQMDVNDVWNHFVLYEGPKGDMAQCRYCERIFARHSKQNRWHLTRCEGAIPPHIQESFRCGTDEERHAIAERQKLLRQKDAAAGHDGNSNTASSYQGDGRDATLDANVAEAVAAVASMSRGGQGSASMDTSVNGDSASVPRPASGSGCPVTGRKRGRPPKWSHDHGHGHGHGKHKKHHGPGGHKKHHKRHGRRRHRSRSSSPSRSRSLSRDVFREPLRPVRGKVSRKAEAIAHFFDLYQSAVTRVNHYHRMDTVSKVFVIDLMDEFWKYFTELTATTKDLMDPDVNVFIPETSSSVHVSRESYHPVAPPPQPRPKTRGRGAATAYVPPDELMNRMTRSSLPTPRLPRKLQGVFKPIPIRRLPTKKPRRHHHKKDYSGSDTEDDDDDDEDAEQQDNDDDDDDSNDDSGSNSDTSDEDTEEQEAEDPHSDPDYRPPPVKAELLELDFEIDSEPNQNHEGRQQQEQQQQLPLVQNANEDDGSAIIQEDPLTAMSSMVTSVLTADKELELCDFYRAYHETRGRDWVLSRTRHYGLNEEQFDAVLRKHSILLNNPSTA